MGGATPAWLQEIRDYWAQLMCEPRPSSQMPQGEQSQDRAGYAGQPRTTSAAAAGTANEN